MLISLALSSGGMVLSGRDIYVSRGFRGADRVVGARLIKFLSHRSPIHFDSMLLL